MLQSDVAVVGAGPAGLSAALAAAEAGATVTVIDEYPRAGGQYFKRAPDEFQPERSQLSREHDRGEKMRRAIECERISFLPQTVVWGIFDDKILMLYSKGDSKVLRAKAIVLATGAHDRPVAFPGWTLPGVMTAGAAQTLSKTQWVLPGRRVLLSGAGPFLLPVAQNLIRAGVKIVAIMEATSPTQWWRRAYALWGQWSRFAEAWDYLRTVRGAGVPFLFRHKVVAAHGDGAVERATISKVDATWHAVPGTEKVLDVDAISVGYGFLPSLELAVSCGCALRWDRSALSWFVDCGPTMATSCAGVFAAGEIVGIAGAAPAMEEGTIAGLGAAEYSGLLDEAEAASRRREPMRRRASLEPFARMINDLFRPRPGLWEGTTDEVTICRCEEVSAGQIRECVRAGCSTPKEIKDWTRAGMGLCQGRICRSLVSTLLSNETRVDPGDIRFPSIRPPIKPVPIRALVETEVP